MAKKISAILCTYNRCQSLAKALESLVASILPATVEWDVLVVDNNSNDGTREVVEGFTRLYPGRFRYLFEPRQGKSHALNSGIREAYGEILVFLDDDVIVRPDWLWNLTAPLQNGEWAGSGGRILPARAFSLPRWLTLSGPYAMGGILCAHFDLGEKPGKLDRPPYGTNMAFHKKMFERYGGFRIDMGPGPGSEIRNEDTEFGRRLMAAGESLCYVPSAVVYHEVPENRVKREFFLAWWFDYGRAQIREGGTRPDVWGIPRRYISIPNNVLRILPFRTLRWLLAMKPEQRFHYKCMVWVTAGHIAEMCRPIFESKRQNETLQDAHRPRNARCEP